MEFIGIIAVIFFAWFLLKNVFRGATRGHQLRVVSHAMSRGVPMDFAKGMLQNREVLLSAMQHMGKHNREFKMKDAYEQQAEAIMMLYQGYLSEQNGVK